MAPVPFTFFTRLLLDDEDRITVIDWDRNDKRGRELDDEDGRAGQFHTHLKLTDLDSTGAFALVDAFKALLPEDSGNYPNNAKDLIGEFTACPMQKNLKYINYVISCASTARW